MDDLIDVWHAGVKVISGLRMDLATEVMELSPYDVAWCIDQIGQCDSPTGLIAVPPGSPQPQPYDPDVHGVPDSRS